MLAQKIIRFLTWLTENEVILSQLPRADLLLKSVAAEVDINIHTLILENALDLLCIVIKSNSNWDHQNLSRTQPEWPLAPVVFYQNTRETLNAACNGSMDHDRTCTAWCEGLDDSLLHIWA